MARDGRDDDTSTVCGPGCACSVGNEFGERTAKREAARYRAKGPERTTGWLIEGLREGLDGDVAGLTVLDIGAGAGAVHLALLAAGASAAVDVDGSPAFIAVARQEALRAGVADKVRHEAGDFVELADRIASADLVALDRVVCCYPDMAALVGRSAGRAGRRLGLVYPRDSWWIRAGGTALNAVMRLVRQRTRVFIHRTADVEAIIVAAGLTRRFHRQGLYWQAAVFERA
jgi:magnesium-protoporphyrin O-methyltransferase